MNVTRLALAFAALTLLCTNGGQADARGAWQQRVSTGFHAQAASFHSSFHNFVNKQFVAPYRYATTPMALRQAPKPATVPQAPPVAQPAPATNPVPAINPAPVFRPIPVVVAPQAPINPPVAPVINPAPAPNNGVQVKGYTTKSGRVVQSYFRSKADHDASNNWGQKGNTDPVTGRKGESHRADKPAKQAPAPQPAPAAPAAPGADAPSTIL